MSEQEEAGSAEWRDRPPLTGTDMTDFLALRRVCVRADSDVDQGGEHFVEDQRPVLPFLADALAALIEVGHVTLNGSDSDGMRRILVTASGRSRYEELCDRQKISPYPPVVIEGTPDR
ncbi:MAG: hypothetical protein ACRDUV_24090 [Pseudonocardiaceae bacterium]